MNEKITYIDALMTDPDSKTPLHDEIVTWCLNNYQYVINKDWFIKHWNGPLDSGNWKMTEISIERPIIKQSYQTKSIIGFADLFISFQNQYQYTETRWDPNISRHIQVTCNDKAIDNFLIEVKSKITSMGGLIRQVNFYKTHLGNNIKTVIVSPDVDSYGDILRSQGIFYFKYAPQ